MGHRDVLPPVTQGLAMQSSLLKSRRWSSPGLAPGLNLYSFYVNTTNQNDAMMREHRKQLCKTAVGRSRDQHKAECENSLNVSDKILAWSRDKYRSWRRRHPRYIKDVDDIPEDQEGEMTSRPLASGSAITRKTSRMSGRSRDSLMRKRSQSTMSSSDTEETKKCMQSKNIRTFWWYCGVIKALCKLGLDMQRLSMRKTEQTVLSELYYVNVSGGAPGEEDDAQILFFDKTLFTRKRAACRVPEWAQNLMIRNPELRKPEDVQHLRQLLLSMRSFREKYTEDMQNKICEVVRYTRCDKGRVILRQGHMGHYFYFIFSGSVFIQIDLYDARTGEVTPSTENIIRTGESFGEIALLGDGIRSATVICREPTELCQIDKSTFLEICPALFQQQLDEKISFAREFELFQKWDGEQLKQLCFLSQVLYVPHGKVLEMDWAATQYVYFVMKGRISLIKEFDTRDPGEEEEVAEDEDWKERARREEEEEHYNVLANVVTARRKLAPTNQGKQQPNIRFACVGTLRGRQYTDLRILGLKPPKLESITLLSEGVRVLRIAARNFVRFAPRRHMEEFLKKHYTPLTIPNSRALVSRYMKDVSWRTFRKRVTGSLQRERSGHLVASIPATAKGTTGWARWPGFDPQAQQKSALLSQRGARSTTEKYLLARPPLQRYRSDASSKTTGQRRAPTMPYSDVTKKRERVTNEKPRIVVHPPPKKHAAYFRRSLDSSLIEED